MPAPAQLLKLIERFNRNRDDYRKGKFNETQLRIDYLNPLFELLGWDISNRAGHSEDERDVIHEDHITVDGATKAPDYCFRIGGKRKFFLEAKKPSVNIKDDIAPAFQLRRYAWSAKLPLSILSDFEEIAIYDCRINPDRLDRASVARISYFTFDQLADRWEEFAAIFSRNAVLNGSLDTFAKKSKTKRGTEQVDDAFLKEIEGWRESLAKDIAKRNTALTQAELNDAVQRTIDRIIFLRICEDRGIEEYGRLQALKNGTNTYARLMQLFHQADARYNSGLFHFRHEKGESESPDQLTPDLHISDAVLKEIFRRLYYPDSPYEFSVIPASILGQVYEQFLGKVILLDAKHRATVEEKPEVRKAGGVYYTPEYIAEYIVNNTVGKLVEGKTPTEVATLRVLDPACGSGSFLLVAYDFLLSWHRTWYEEHEPKKLAAKKNAPVYSVTLPAAPGETEPTTVWRLTTAEKKRILLANIYGVDIDRQAVEVTKLSLLLKMLEGESEQTLGKQMKLMHDRVLPDLCNNIKCGNSLISSDFYDDPANAHLDLAERQRINAFDWNDEFPEIMKRGGFDAVIGNPPYGFHQIYLSNFKKFFKEKFVSSQGSYENYLLFYEKSLKLLRNGGVHGYIVPVTWLTIPSAKSLRKFIIDNYWINQICWLPEMVFENAQVNTLISIIVKSESKFVEVRIHQSLDLSAQPSASQLIKQTKLIDEDYSINIFSNESDDIILSKIEYHTKLSDIAKPCSGYNPYEVGKGFDLDGKPHTKETIKSRPYHSDKKISHEWKPEIIGRNISRYSLNISKDRWIKYGIWLAAPRDLNNFIGNRILVQEITGGKDKRIIATFTNIELYHSRDVIPIKFENNAIDPKYVLAIINSKLITYYHHKRNPKAQKGLFPKVLVSDLAKIPIPIGDPTIMVKLSQLVDSIMNANVVLKTSKNQNEIDFLEKEIRQTDKKIDRLVYELYGLTEEEIAIVEGEG